MAESLTQLINANQVEKQAAPEAAASPAKAVSSKRSVVDQLVAAGEATYDASKAGVNSHKVAFVANLGDPSELDRPKLKGDDGTKVFPRIVGYRFRALEDLENVPDFGTTKAFNGPRLNDAADVTKFRSVAAGEEFDLTRVETLAFFGTAEMGMVATGGDTKVRCQVAFNRMKDINVTASRDLPSIQLTVLDGGSIKEAPFIAVLDYEPDTASSFAVGKRTVKPEFANTKFANRALAPSERKIVRKREKSADTVTRDTVIAVQTLFNRIGAAQGR